MSLSCWFFHSWQKWEVKTFIIRYRLNNGKLTPEGEAEFQIRKCNRCGIEQRIKM